MSGLNKASDSSRKLPRSSTYIPVHPSASSGLPTRKCLNRKLLEAAFPSSISGAAGIIPVNEFEMRDFIACETCTCYARKSAKTSGFTLSDLVHVSKLTHDTLHDRADELLSFIPFGRFCCGQILQLESRNLLSVRGLN